MSYVELISRPFPETLNPSARELNGSEDGSDYLWLAQDMWTESNVWEWANKQSDTKRFLLRTCSRGGCRNTEKTVAEFKRCAACHQVWYCSKDCQKLDWRVHKQRTKYLYLVTSRLTSHLLPACDEHKRFKATMKSIATGAPMPKNVEPFLGADDQSVSPVFLHTAPGH